ncbi:MAG: PilN domain-containing protein [Candidatus Saccharimonadales bacterium]|jgi:Tfp pilus assembly protein PilN
MVQFNLLPDVKLEFVKARRLKHTVMVVAMVTTAIAVGVCIIAFFIANIVQKQQLRSLDVSIKEKSAEIASIKDIDKILTVQNQLNTLTGLHDRKHAPTRVFGYLSQLTPADTSLDKFSADFTANTATVSGTAVSLNLVRSYADTLKRTQFQVEGGDKKTKAFSNVVLSTFSRDDKSATFQITFSFDPTIFDITKKVQLLPPSSANASAAGLFEEDR